MAIAPQKYSSKLTLMRFMIIDTCDSEVIDFINGGKINKLL